LIDGGDEDKDYDDDDDDDLFHFASPFVFSQLTAPSSVCEASAICYQFF